MELEDMLRKYLQVQYDYAWYKAGGVSAGPTDWEHVEYSDMLPQGLGLKVPIDRDYSYVYQLYAYFNSLKQPTQVFKIKDTNFDMMSSSNCLHPGTPETVQPSVIVGTFGSVQRGLYQFGL
ncbi:hypothetical protein E1B28_002908 [Marasmius oreades]|uniref:Uncharacterized protein n=1 Tax=Marasmius oreades TaxID=181124 RepID=A0A9P7RKV5_9AGAR|nr:uncharacterized protein E1B28_002908 [Marasmius oreades]KAG7085342.1 hypothetical protein E1B28_002908 [Marasmius oreades]